MKREIKFRVWDGKTMHDVFMIDLYDGGVRRYKVNDDIDSHYDN